jgi:hypothetical protein
MSSNKRARTRAIRAKMATSGESYSRAARAARTLLAATRGTDHVLRWSLFRRLHQTRALISHYRRRGDPLPAELRM